MAQNKDFNYSLRFSGVDRLSSPLGKIQKAIGTTSADLRQLRQHEKQFGRFKTLRDGSLKTARDIRLASSETAELGRQIKQVDKPTKKMTAQFRRAQEQVRKLKEQQAREIAELGKLGKSLKTAGYHTGDFSKDQRRLKSDIHRTSQELEQHRRELKRVGDEYKRQRAAKDQYQQSMQSAANLGIVGASGVAVGTRAIRGTFSMVETIRPLEAAIGGLQSLGVENLATYKTAAEKIEGKLAYTTADSFVSAAYDVRSGMSGLSDEGVVAITEYALTTARATKASAEQMTALNAVAYGTFKSQYAELSDIEWAEQFNAGLASSVQAFKTNGAAMQQAIESAGPKAALMGMGMEEQLAVLGALQGLMKEGVAGTGLKSYASNAAKAHEAFEKSGRNIRILDEEGMLRDTRQVMDDIRAAYGDKLDGFEMAEIKKAFGSEEASKLIEGLMANAENFKSGYSQVSLDMKAGRSVIDNMAAAMDNNGDAQIQKAMEDWAAMKRDIGYALMPVFTAMIPVFKNITSWVRNFSKEHKTLVGVLGGGVVIFGVLAAVMGGLTIAIASVLGPFAMLKYAKTVLGLKSLGLMRILKPLGHAFIWLGKAAIPPLIAGVRAFGMALMTTPLGWIIGGLALLAGAAWLIIKKWKPIKAFFAKTWAVFKTLFAWSPIGLLMRGFGKAFGWLIGLFKRPVDSAGKTWSFFKTLFAWSPLGLLGRGIGSALKWITGLFKGPRQASKRTWTVFRTLFAWSPVGLLMRGMGAALRWLTGAFKAPLTLVRSVWGGLKTVMSWSPLGMLGRAWGGVKDLSGRTWQGVQSAASGAWSGLKTVLGWSPLPLLAGSWTGIKEHFSSLFDRVTGLAKAAMERVSGFFTSAFAKVKTLWGRIREVAKDVRQMAGTGMRAGTKAGMTLSGMTLATPAMAAMTLHPPITQAAPAIQSSGSIIQHNQIHVHAAPGMNEQELARLVAREVERLNRDAQRDAHNSLYDLES